MKITNLLAAMALVALVALIVAPPAMALNVQSPAIALDEPMVYGVQERAVLAAYSNDAVDGGSELPYGDLIGHVLTSLLGLVALAGAWLARKLPGGIVATLNQLSGLFGAGRVDQLLDKAITYGINVTAGAVKGKSLSVKIGNEVLERAFEYAIRHAPTVVRLAGGSAFVREKIIGRLDLDADVALPAARPPAELTLERVSLTAPPAPPSAPAAAAPAAPPVS